MGMLRDKEKRQQAHVQVNSVCVSVLCYLLAGTPLFVAHLCPKRGRLVLTICNDALPANEAWLMSLCVPCVPCACGLLVSLTLCSWVLSSSPWLVISFVHIFFFFANLPMLIKVIALELFSVSAIDQEVGMCREKRASKEEHENKWKRENGGVSK